jgi:uncharacterized membrane protein
MSADVASDKHLHRLILFSDAVFAIAITLLAIEIHPPEHWSTIGELFQRMGYKLAAYAVSFAVVGIYWITHRRMCERLVRADIVLDALNLAMLGLVALLPLGTERLWEHAPAQAILVYVGLVAAIGVASGVMWGYAVFIGKLSEPLPRLEAVFLLLRMILLPGLMSGLSIFSLTYPWGWGLMGLLVAGTAMASRVVRRRSAAPPLAASMATSAASES